MAYTVVRTDNLTGITDGSKILSVKFYKDAAPAAVENGTVCKITGVEATPDRQVFKVEAGADAAALASAKAVLIAAPELIKDRKYNALDEYINGADEIVRAYVLEAGDEFSVTAEGISGTVAAGATLAAGTDGKLAAGEGFLEVVKTETVGSKKYYVIRVS